MPTQAASAIAPVRHAAEEISARFPALMIEAERIAHTVAAGLHGRRRAGPGETFWQHRAYAFGDPVNAIDWRQSARAADRLYVRQNEWEAAAAVWVWRDPSRSLDYASSPAAPTKRQRADVLAAALAILLSQAGERVGVLGAGRRPFHGRGAPTRFLETLGIDRFADGDAPLPPAPGGAGTRIVFISDFLFEPARMANAIAACAAAGAKGAVLQIVDPAEEEFPFAGRTEFENPEAPERLLFGDAGALARDYRAAFAAHRNALETACRRHAWSFSVHRTDRPAEAALLSLFVALGDFRILK